MSLPGRARSYHLYEHSEVSFVPLDIINCDSDLLDVEEVEVKGVLSMSVFIIVMLLQVVFSGLFMIEPGFFGYSELEYRLQGESDFLIILFLIFLTILIKFRSLIDYYLLGG